MKTLTTRLPQDSITEWLHGEPAPANDPELLLLMGSLSREQLEACPKVELVQVIHAGYEDVEIDAATELGIWVSYAPSDRTGNAASVAEYAVMLLLATARRLVTSVESIKDPAVDRPVLTASLIGKSVCLIGLGAVGRALLDRLRPFELRVTAVNPHPEKAPADVPTLPLDRLKEAVATADFVVVSLRATEENKGLVDASVLAAMKRGSILINVARGSLIDEVALAQAMKSGHIAAVGLDVLEREPADGSDPLVQQPTSLVTPHLAGFTDVMLEGLVAFVLETVRDFKAQRRFASLLNHPPVPRVRLSQ